MLLVIVRAPKPPGSSASISPQSDVLEIAPANVLHGAVRLHGLASSPAPEIQVRVACVCAGPVNAQKLTASAVKDTQKRRFIKPTILIVWRSAIAGARPSLHCLPIPQ